MTTWRERAMALIARVHGGLGDACSLDELKSELRKHANSYHGGTSWGKRVWYQAKAQYYRQHFGVQPEQKPAEASPLCGDHVHFPYREKAEAQQ